MKKNHHYGIRRILNDWFRSYLSDRNQFVYILGFDSNTSTIRHSVPQGSVLAPLLFLIYINDLYCDIKKHFSVYHFADDTSLLQIDKSYKKIQNNLNYDLKCLYNWLLAKKISLNATKTELIFFRKPSEKIRENIVIKLNGKKHHTSHIKYLGVYLDEFLDGSAHCLELQLKLRCSTGIPAKPNII